MNKYTTEIHNRAERMQEWYLRMKEGFKQTYAILDQAEQILNNPKSKLREICTTEHLEEAKANRYTLDQKLKELTK